MSINEPTASAFRWQVTSGASTPQTYDLACFANQVFSTEVGFRTVYRAQGGEWKYLIEPTMFDGDDFETKTDTILGQISKKVREFFLLDDTLPPIPETLYQQIEQLLQSGVEWDSSNLVKK